MPKADGTLHLVLANAATATLALLFHWPLGAVLWPFWVQSVVIGWYNRQRILALTNFTTEGFRINHEPVPENHASLERTAGFFTLHYGFFHFGYFCALLKIATVPRAIDWLGLAVAAASFVASARSTFRRNVEIDRLGRPNLGALMFLPYARIIPMHVMILFGAHYVDDSRIALLAFLTLKTGADVLMFHVDHHIAQRAAAAAVANGTHQAREV